jgi:hypothetical protein
VSEFPPPPKTKEEFYRRYMAGEFGNRPTSWACFSDLVASGYEGRVGIRNMVPGGPFHYGVKVSDLKAGCWPAGAHPSSSRFSTAMPDDRLAVQGNVQVAVGGLTLEYSCEKNVSHRQAVRQPLLRHAYRLEAVGLLRTHLWGTSLDDINELLHNYPGAVIEFSAYETAVGLLPRRNTVFWEVRDY